MSPRRLPAWRTLAVLSAVAVVVSTLPGVALTNASWVDEEHAYGTLGASQCGVSSDFDSRATGRMVAGAIANTPIDPVVALHGIVVSNYGSTATATASSTPGGADAYYSSLAATAISTALVNAGLSLPLAWNTGAWTQYGQAHDTGISTGAAGAVTNVGAINTTTTGPTAAPTVGSLALSSLPYVGAPLSGLSDVKLDIGAVASRATLDGCGDAWTAGAPTAAQLQRSYYVSHLRAQLTSAALAGLMGTTGAVPTTVNGLGTIVTTAQTNITTKALNGLLGTVTTAVNGINVAGIGLQVGTGHLGSTTIALNLAPVTALLTGPLDDGVVNLDLASGAVTIDIAGLAGDLSTKPANTSLLTAPQLNDVVTRLSGLLTTRLGQIDTALTTALSAATISIDLDVNVRLNPGSVNVIGVKLGYTGTIQQFALGTQTVTGPSVSLLGTGGLVGWILDGLVSGLLANLLTGLGTLTTTVRNAVGTDILPLTGTVTGFLSGATTSLTTAITALGGTLTALGGIVSLTLNSQPDQLPNPAAPYAGGGPGEYFVSALRVGVLDRTGGGANSLVNLFLATSSVGSNAS